jgi:hypothetical protein
MILLLLLKKMLLLKKKYNRDFLKKYYYLMTDILSLCYASLLLFIFCIYQRYFSKIFIKGISYILQISLVFHVFPTFSITFNLWFCNLLFLIFGFSSSISIFYLQFAFFIFHVYLLICGKTKIIMMLIFLHFSHVYVLSISWQKWLRFQLPRYTINPYFLSL